MRVSAPIDLRAVQLYSRIAPSLPSSVVLQKSNLYSEKLEIQVLDETGKVLTDSYFNEKVRINNELKLCSILNIILFV